MENFSKFRALEDYGFFDWLPIDKDHAVFTRDDINRGLDVSGDVAPPPVNRDVFEPRYSTPAHVCHLVRFMG